MNQSTKETGIERKCLRFFVGMLIVGAILIIVYLAVTGNRYQVFKDVVKECTSMDGSNKSAERMLFYIFAIIGSILYFVFYLKSSIETDAILEIKEKTGDAALYVISALLVFSGVYYFIYSGTNWLLLSAMMLSLILYVADKALVIPGTAFLFICSYAVSGLYRAYVFIGGQKSLSMMTVALISLLTSLAILACGKNQKGKVYLKGIMVLQIIVPFSMLVYLASKYKYGEEYIDIHIPYRIQIVVYGLIILFVAEAVLRIYKKWDNVEKLGDIVTYGACIAIMSFNRFGGTGSIFTADLHHPFENIIGYSQIIELGQKAFSEYIPVSGMYSVVHGFFFAFFGHGQVSFYYLTTNLFLLLIIILIVILLKQQLRGEWVLLISLIFYVLDYDRIVFIVPVMLLLAWPKLIEKKNLWLKAWYLTSFLHVLYYPVFGAAVCFGYLPLGIWQVVTYAKSGELKKDVKKVSFWIWWLICCVPLVLGFNDLLGTVKHMKAMGSQTVYADGITRFGQAVPGNFMSYIQLLPTRLVVYYIFSFLIVVSIVWLAVALCLKAGNIKIANKRLAIENPVPAFISLSFGIALLVAFSYTVIRMDINSIYARSAGMVYASFVMILLVLSRYLASAGNRHCIFCFAVFIIAAVSAEGFLSMGSSSKLEAYYTVPDGYIYVVDDQVERLGECFLAQGTYDDIESTYKWAAGIDRNESYLGIVSDFGLYYLCNFKGDSAMETETIKGYGAAQETVDLIRQNDTIVGSNIYSVYEYYFYHWLITSGEYIWDTENRRFIPNDGSVSKEEILLKNKNIDLARENEILDRTAGSWGKSMDTLNDIFTDVNVDYDVNPTDSGVTVDFDGLVEGDEADFLYLELAGVDQNYEYILFNHQEDALQNVEEYPYIKGLMKKDYNRDMIVVVSWFDENGNEHSMNCRMDQGKLLIPIGSGRGWLLNGHSNIMISVMQGETTLEVPEITGFRFLKLQEVK